MKSPDLSGEILDGGGRLGINIVLSAEHPAHQTSSPCPKILVSRQSTLISYYPHLESVPLTKPNSWLYLREKALALWQPALWVVLLFRVPRPVISEPVLGEADPSEVVWLGVDLVEDLSGL